MCAIVFGTSGVGKFSSAVAHIPKKQGKQDVLTVKFRNSQPGGHGTKAHGNSLFARLPGAHDSGASVELAVQRIGCLLACVQPAHRLLHTRYAKSSAPMVGHVRLYCGGFPLAL